MPEPTMYKELLMVRLGELFLKGGNRKVFMKRQRQNLVNGVRRHTDDFKITMHNWRYLIELDDASKQDVVLESLKNIPGVTSVSLVRGVASTEEAVMHHALMWTQEAWQNKKGTFAVRVKRNYKHFPVNSMDFAREVGGRIKMRSGRTVNLKNADLKLHIEIEKDQSFIWVDSQMGVGGLPVGISGKVLLLLSGGIDSPVAGFLTQKRGCLVDAIYFHSPPFISEASKDKVISLAEKLATRQSKLRLHVVHFTEIQKAIKKHCEPRYTVLLYRRFMYRIANQWAEEQHYDALVTGENLGQVASQTIPNLRVVDDITQKVVLRPLITYDKQEIIKVAEQIDTFSISIQPFDDCCTLFVPDKPSTKARVFELEYEEAKLDVETLVQAAIEEIELIELR